MLKQNLGRGPKEEKIKTFLFNQHPWIILDPSLRTMPGDPMAESLNPTSDSGMSVSFCKSQ